MEPADRPALVALWVASWREAMPEIDFDARRDWIDTVLCHAAPRTWVAVDTATRAALGFVLFEGAYLHQLVVAPAAKGGGIATRLLDAAKRMAPAAGLTLDVNQANARAVRFYRREGFAAVAAGTNPTSGLATWRMRWRP